MTTKEQIEVWFDVGVSLGATHMIVATDTFEWEDYPVYVLATQDVWEVFRKYDGPNMQKVMEVYNLQSEKQPQLDAARSWSIGYRE